MGFYLKNKLVKCNIAVSSMVFKQQIIFLFVTHEPISGRCRKLPAPTPFC